MRNLAIVFLMAIALGSTAAEYVVDSSGSADYVTIQSALDVAGVGDIVTVNMGTYVENLTMASGVTLQSASGSAATVIDGEGYI